MKLNELLNGLPFTVVKGSLDTEVKDIRDNSKLVEPGDLFLAVVGTTVDSHKFIPSAIAQGATVIVVERDVEIEGDVTVILVESSRNALPRMASTFYGNPAEKLTMVGITGTCGKTSTSYLIRQILEKSGVKVGVIGTIGAFIDGKKVETHNTTPNPYEIQHLLHQMVEAGCQYCVMEVSSQGLKMGRVAGIIFDYGLFTNLALDHIGPNEHENYEEYRHCKSLLFHQCKVGIINKDAQDYQFMMESGSCRYVTFGLGHGADLGGGGVDFVAKSDFFGMAFTTRGLVTGDFAVSMPGQFSVYNALAAITLTALLDIPLWYIQEALKTAQVDGRVELASANDTYRLLIDYAHNSEEIVSLMETLRGYQAKRLVCIFGCGGNRAPARRVDTGEIVAKYADFAIITEDNPRFEQFESINEGIFEGMAKAGGMDYVVIKDRDEAIYQAMATAQEGDLILLLGKGHETYQDIEGVYHPWDERAAVARAEARLKGDQ